MNACSVQGGSWIWSGYLILPLMGTRCSISHRRIDKLFMIWVGEMDTHCICWIQQSSSEAKRWTSELVSLLHCMMLFEVGLGMNRILIRNRFAQDFALDSLLGNDASLDLESFHLFTWQVKPPKFRTFPIDDANRVFLKLSQSKLIGRVVFRVFGEGEDSVFFHDMRIPNNSSFDLENGYCSSPDCAVKRMSLFSTTSPGTGTPVEQPIFTL